MASISTYLANALLNESLRNVGFSQPAVVYLALYTNNPTAADTGTEVAGSGYGRQTVTFNAASSGVVVNTSDVNFTNMPATTVAYVAVRDASSGGNLLYFVALSVPKTVNLGDTFTVRAGDLNVSFV